MTNNYVIYNHTKPNLPSSFDLRTKGLPHSDFETAFSLDDNLRHDASAQRFSTSKSSSKDEAQ